MIGAQTGVLADTIFSVVLAAFSDIGIGIGTTLVCDKLHADSLIFVCGKFQKVLPQWDSGVKRRKPVVIHIG